MTGCSFRGSIRRVASATLIALALLTAGCGGCADLGSTAAPTDEAASPPPPPPPPPPPSPSDSGDETTAAVATTTTAEEAPPSLVFFEYGSATLTPEAGAVLDNFAEEYRSNVGGRVSIAGGSDRSEARTQPADLSLRRAEAVRTYLVARGVPSRQINVEGLGASRPLVETADDAREPQNRFAIVEFAAAGACPPGALAPKTGSRVFALPPPRPSAFANLPPAAFRVAGGRTTYADIDDRLTAALERAGYPPRSYYATCGGFAVVTRVERVRADGRPFDQPRRFVSMSGTYSTVEDFTIGGIIRALTTVQPGRFRVLVFLVTDQLVSFSDDMVAPAEAEQWVVRGTTDLAPTIATTPVPATFYVKALVYEFRKVGDRVEFVADGRPALQQLRDANVRIGTMP